MSDSHATTEIWKPVPKWEGLYEASNQGRIRALRGYHQYLPNRIISTRPNDAGYLTVQLNKPPGRATKALHRVIAETFIGPLPNGWHTNHKNGNKLDNRVENLQYCTPWENQQHASRMGLLSTGERHGTKTKPESVCRGERNPSSRFTDAQVRHIRRMKTEGYQQNWIALFYGVSRMAIQHVVLRKTWAHLD